VVNYLAVRGIVLRKLNRQRLSIVWMVDDAYASFLLCDYTGRLYLRGRRRGEVYVDLVSTPRRTPAPTPEMIASLEKILERRPGRVRNHYPNLIHTYQSSTPPLMGEIHIGHSPSTSTLKLSELQKEKVEMELDIFKKERFIVWVSSPSSFSSFRERRGGRVLPTVHVFLKQGYTSLDQIKGWVTAVRFLTTYHGTISIVGSLRDAKAYVEERFDGFVGRLEQFGWELDELQLLTGVPFVVGDDRGEDKED